MYTNTPDFDFIVDFHPQDERVVLLSPCSGHGFKLSNVMGSIGADLVTEGSTGHEIGLMSLARFSVTASDGSDSARSEYINA